MPTAPADWSDEELRSAILQSLLEARMKKPKAGGASLSMLCSRFGLSDTEKVDSALSHLRASGLVESDEISMITSSGVERLIRDPQLASELRLVLRRLFEVLVDSRNEGLSAADLLESMGGMKGRIDALEFAFWYLREKGMIELDERLFRLNSAGVEYLRQITSRPD